MDKRVLITGSSRGIGKGIALYLANLGYKIILHYNKNQELAEKVLSDVKKTTSGWLLSFDVSNRKEAKEVLSRDMERHGAYYGVICNAGITNFIPFRALEGKQWDDLIEV
ncbi:MAG: SDR family NAD(P)-dependent oxidoreductase, partial [Holosporaceae bacterium]|nr:SDR family NAD(P)-dependent oxidoreductase [Holosporaceae bacterium]